MKSKLLSCLTAAAALLAAHASAQDQVSMKLDIIAWGPKIEGLSLKTGGETITAQPFIYTKAVSYSGSSILELHQSTAAAAATTEASQSSAPIPPELAKLRAKDPTIVGLAKLPVGSRRATVLVAPAASGTYLTMVIDDDPSKLPFGKLRIHNYSPLKIAMRCNGKTQKELKTRDAFIVEPNSNNEVIYELAYDEKGTWQMQENNLIPVRKDEQVQLIVLKSDADFFTSSDGSKSGFLQTVTLRRPAKELTAEATP
ncbi:hypothetical protein [Luteolibacter luteus]|uniref:DUF3108 domain-containing protein n=1 Tax=Luteolibacter luteus TaxID=2728835 RepID=A0A858RQU8_9BACT|nr:hypothetical protein [Luteolibacter luteus]QJE98719.1 hypothetical protein HHL09_24040 [Luteolibacter luteus]